MPTRRGGKRRCDAVNTKHGIAHARAPLLIIEQLHTIKEFINWRAVFQTLQGALGKIENRIDMRLQHAA